MLGRGTECKGEKGMAFGGRSKAEEKEPPPMHDKGIFKTTATKSPQKGKEGSGVFDILFFKKQLMGRIL